MKPTCRASVIAFGHLNPLEAIVGVDKRNVGAAIRAAIRGVRVRFRMVAPFIDGKG